MTHRAWVRWMHPAQAHDLRRLAAPATGRVPAERGRGIDTGVTLPGTTLAASIDRTRTQISCDEGAAEERDPAALPLVAYFEAGKGFVVGDIDVEPFTIPHDAADPVGFVFEGEGVRIGFATDLGYMPANARQALRRCDVLMLESNHDTEMLRDGPYPWSVKQRVMSRVGHLSNEAAADFLERNYDGQAGMSSWRTSRRAITCQPWRG